ncbi:hypothetical protein CH337_19825 [Rhodoblastus acidophilus]|nr:hypothetical protein CKO16_00035 [Rhodoblastus acidophilus]RAI16738.1 hypothetical protein CH337_19825 [Rhodoblastus acidophilus]
MTRSCGPRARAARSPGWFLLWRRGWGFTPAWSASWVDPSRGGSEKCNGRSGRLVAHHPAADPVPGSGSERRQCGGDRHGLPHPAQPRRQAIVLGAAGAIVFRLLLTGVAGVLIGIPLLKLVSAFLLIVIAVNLSAAEPGDEAPPQTGEAARENIVGAALVIVMADAIMSLDNVVALAAITAGDFWLLRWASP